MNAESEGRNTAAPDCNRCAAYFITHDPAFPYGCRAMGFSSRRLPCREVLAASGVACRYYQPKPAGVQPR